MNPMTLKINCVFSILFCLLLSSCETPPEKPVSYITMANRLLSKTAKQLKVEKGLIPIGDMGQMMGNIQAMGLSFQYFHIINLEEARNLLVYASNVFLNNINENKEIRPYLNNYPFTPKNIELVIFLYQSDRNNPTQGSLAVLTLIRGILTYKLAAPDQTTLWPILHEETYEEGLEIYQNSKNESDDS
jgi:hypothetical protein